MGIYLDSVQLAAASLNLFIGAWQSASLLAEAALIVMGTAVFSPIGDGAFDTTCGPFGRLLPNSWFLSFSSTSLAEEGGDCEGSGGRVHGI